MAPVGAGDNARREAAKYTTYVLADRLQRFEARTRLGRMQAQTLERVVVYERNTVTVSSQG